MNETFETLWDNVEEYLETAKGIAFDGCHKVYVLMDDQQVELMREYGYGEDDSLLHTSDDLTAPQMLAKLHNWFDDSCGLRFVQAIETVEGNPNDGFTSLIPQGFEEETEDEDLCPDCGDATYFNSGLCFVCGSEDEEEE